MTRNAVVVSPHPLAREVCADAARALAAAATAAGAPDGVVQVVEEPTIPLIEALMTDERTNVIVATGGVAVVRAAYGSGNPAIGVGPGNVPVLVDATADLAKAAERIVDTKSFDNSILCTNESVLIASEPERRAAAAAEQPGAYLLEPGERDRISAMLFPEAASTSGSSARTRAGSPPRPGSGCRTGPGSCSRRSTWSCPRSRWRARSCARCSAWSACPTPGAASTPPGPCCGWPGAATRPSSTAPTRRRSWPTARRWRCCGSRSTRAAAWAARASTPTWPRR